MTSATPAVRSALGLRLTRNRPELSVTFEPSTPDERRQAVDVGVAQNDGGELLLALGHLGKRRVLRRLVTAWMRPVSCSGKNPLGNRRHRDSR